MIIYTYNNNSTVLIAHYTFEKGSLVRIKLKMDDHKTNIKYRIMTHFSLYRKAHHPTP